MAYNIGMGSDNYLATGMCTRCALVVIVFMARDLGVISNSKLRARMQPYLCTFFASECMDHEAKLTSSSGLATMLVRAPITENAPDDVKPDNDGMAERLRSLQLMSRNLDG